MSDPTAENSNSKATRHAVDAVKEVYEIKNLLDQPLVTLESRLNDRINKLERNFRWFVTTYLAIGGIIVGIIGLLKP